MCIYHLSRPQQKAAMKKLENFQKSHDSRIKALLDEQGAPLAFPLAFGFCSARLRALSSAPSPTSFALIFDSPRESILHAIFLPMNAEPA